MVGWMGGLWGVDGKTSTDGGEARSVCSKVLLAFQDMAALPLVCVQVSVWKIRLWCRFVFRLGCLGFLSFRRLCSGFGSVGRLGG